MVIWVIQIILFSSFVSSCLLLLISSASVRSIPFLSFIVPIFAWNVPLVFLIFVKRSLVFSILFSSDSLQWSHSQALLSLLVVFWNSAFRWVYLSFSPWPFTSLLFLAICKTSSDDYFAFPFLKDGFDHSSYTMLMNLHPQFFRQSIISNPLNLFVPSTV